MKFFTTCENLHLFTRLSHFVIPISWDFLILHFAMCFMMGKSPRTDKESMNEIKESMSEIKIWSQLRWALP